MPVRLFVVIREELSVKALLVAYSPFAVPEATRVKKSDIVLHRDMITSLQCM